MTADPATEPAPAPGQEQSRPQVVAIGREGVEYRVHELNGRRFLQYPRALMAMTREGEPYQILAGKLGVSRATQLRDLDADRLPEKSLTDTVFVVTYEAREGDVLEVPVAVSDLDAREPQWPDQLGIRARASKRSLEKIGDAFRAFAATLSKEEGWTYGYACTGPIRLEEGAWAWLRPGKSALLANGTDPALTAEIPRGIGSVHGVKVLDVDDPSGPGTAADDLAALLRFLDLVPEQPEIPFALLAQLAWSPMAAIPDLGRVAVALAGETGSRKTALTGLLVAAQSTTFAGGKGIEVPVTVKMRGNQSTVFGTDQLLHPLSGLLAMVDDWFAGRMTEKEIAEAWKRLSLMGDNVATGSGGTRGGYRNGQGTVAKSVYPRCCILATCERFPDEAKHASETARYVALELRTPVNLDVLSEMQGTARALSRAHAALIQACLRNTDRVYAALDWGRKVAESWDHGGHGRVTYGYARLLAGAAILGHQVRDVLGIDPEPLLVDAVQLLEKAARDQTRRSGMRGGRDMARDPVTLFVKHFRQALAGDPVWAAAPERTSEGHYIPPVIPGHGAPALGWRQIGETLTPAGKGDPIGAVVVNDGSAGGRPPWRPVMLRMRATRFQEIYDLIARRVVAEDGWTLPSPQDLRQRLAAPEAGYLKAASSSPHDLWDSKPNCYLWDLALLLDGEDEEGPGQPPEQDTAPESPEPPAPVPASVQEQPELPERAEEGLCPACGTTVSPVVIGLYDGYHPNCAPEEMEERPSVPDTQADSPRETGLPTPSGQTDGPSGEPSDRPVQTPESAPAPTARPEIGSQREDVTRPQGGRRRTYTHRFAVLDIDGLHTLNGPAIECELPASKSAALALAEQHDIKQLWIHPRAAAALGLPAPDDRTDIPTDAGSPHPWADDEALRCDPEGVAPWMVVWPRGKSRNDHSRSIVLPHLETRAAWAYDGDGELRDTTGQVLLNALQKFTAAIGADYYWSPNATTGLLARRHCRTLKDSVCDSILDGKVPPAIGYSKMLASKWSRPLTPQERKALAVIRLDRNAAYLSAMNILLGVGEPTYKEGEGITFTRKKAGYWRIRQAPTGLDPLLPELRFKPGRDGHIWLTTPDMALLEDLGILPEITAAWIWEDSRKVLSSLYDVIRIGREALRLEKAAATGDQAAAIAHALTADLYKSFTGYIARTEGPRAEDKRGPDLLWRPDWRDHILAEAGARMYRNLLDEATGIDPKTGEPKGTGRRPIGSYVDAAYYTTTETDPIQARPPGLKYHEGRGGAWKNEGYVPLAALGRAPGTPKFHERFDIEWEKIQKQESQS